jgi:LPS-assembly lipoprotein
VLLVVLTLLLSSCGFHLRGSTSLPTALGVTMVQDAATPTAVARELRQVLTANGARVTDSAAEAQATVRIVGEQSDRRLAGTGQTSKEKQYELQYTVTFAAGATDKSWNVDEQSLAVTRQMMFDETQVLAKTAEQEQLQQVMVQDAARQILARIKAQAK